MKRPRRHAARDGIAILTGDRVLSLAMIVAFSSLLFMSAVWVAELFFVEDVLGRGDVAYGLMFTFWTTGMAIGALAIPRRVAVSAVAATALLAVVVQGAGLALPALVVGYGFFLACSVAGGIAHGVKNVMFRSLIHTHVPEPLHGRAFAAYNGIRNSAELGSVRRRRAPRHGDRPARHDRLGGDRLGARRDRRAAPAAAPQPWLGADRADRGGTRARLKARAPRSGSRPPAGAAAG